MSDRVPVGVLVSGSGSNLQALIDACAASDFPARIALVISNVPTAFGLERARKAGIRAEVLDHRGFSDRNEFDRRLAQALRAASVEWVCLAGFMRIVGPELLRAFSRRVLNIHPALLPAFPGLHAARQALAHGAKISGCTVHFVDEGTDTGPIIAQTAVPVLSSDSEESLAARILVEEHKLYPLALNLATSGRLRVEGRVVRITGDEPTGGRSLMNPVQ